MLTFVKKKTRKLALDKIKLDGEWGERTWLTGSMGAVGQLQPIVVFELALSGGLFAIADGRHRVTSARALGWKRIEAVVFMPGEAEMMDMYLAGIALAGNAHAANKLSEARAAQTVGVDRAIELSGLTKGALRARDKLLSLTTRFQIMYEKGELAQAAAKELVKLPKDQQQEAWDKGVEGRGDGRSPSAIQVRREVRRILGELQPCFPVPAPAFALPENKQVNKTVLAGLVWDVFDDRQDEMQEHDLAAVKRVVEMLEMET